MSKSIDIFMEHADTLRDVIAGYLGGTVKIIADDKKNSVTLELSFKSYPGAAEDAETDFVPWRYSSGRSRAIEDIRVELIGYCGALGLKHAYPITHPLTRDTAEIILYFKEPADLPYGRGQYKLYE